MAVDGGGGGGGQWLRWEWNSVVVTDSAGDRGTEGEKE